MQLYELAWVVPLIPIICFLIAGLLGNKMKEGGGYLVIAGGALSCIASVFVSVGYFVSPLYDSGLPYVNSIEWLAFGEYRINFGVYIDSLSCIMMLFASFISTLIFIYSLGYMGDQKEKKRRYYAEVSLFLTGMLGLVVSSNYLEMFIFWEIMGLCSYLLIGFWSFKHPEGEERAVNAASAAKKAFLVTRLGDVCLMGGMLILLYLFKSLDYTVIFSEGAIQNIVDSTENGGHLIAIAGLLIFGGVIGKSAQFPLHDWLPDAMAGPTTVSALIHAATMVKAGVFLTARSFPILVENTNVTLFVAIIGGITAIFAASMAMNNMNIKKVLAFSTLSQLGYMILALGAGGYLMGVGMETGDEVLIELGVAGYAAGIFHMVNHAFFKALLFLCSGSVIHSCGTEDMRLMGGLFKKMKATAITMLIGSLSIAGIPILSGFWSKDLVLEAAFGPYEHGLGAGSWFCVLFILGLITAFMTAFYMFRMWFMTFVGEPRQNAKHCHGESPGSMVGPLTVLSIFAIGTGLLIFGGFIACIGMSLVSSNLIPTSFAFKDPWDEVGTIVGNVWTYVSIALAVIGIALAYLMYSAKKVDPAKFNGNGKMGLYKLIANRYYFPEIYNGISWGVGYGVSKGVDAFDRKVIDGTVNALSDTVVGGGDVLTNVQTGRVRNYANYVVIGVLAVIAILLAILCANGVI